MQKIDLSLCECNDYIPLGANGDFDDSKNGEYGYRVFYNVPKSEVDKLGVFKDMDELKELEEDEDYCGEIEFSVDENGEQYGEVLLWCTITSEEECENIDFVDYDEDISQLVDEFNNELEKDKGEK